MIAEFILANYSRAQQLWTLQQEKSDKKQSKIDALEKKIIESHVEIFGSEPNWKK